MSVQGHLAVSGTPVVWSVHCTGGLQAGGPYRTTTVGDSAFGFGIRAGGLPGVSEVCQTGTGGYETGYGLEKG